MYILSQGYLLNANTGQRALVSIGGTFATGQSVSNIAVTSSIGAAELELAFDSFYYVNITPDAGAVDGTYTVTIDPDTVFSCGTQGIISVNFDYTETPEPECNPVTGFAWDSCIAVSGLSWVCIPVSSITWDCIEVTNLTWNLNCAEITGVSVSPDPLNLDAGDSGVIQISLTGGNNDGSDQIVKQHQMPDWMNDGDVIWDSVNGYHVPYTVPANYWTTNASPIDMSVYYTATNSCSSPAQSNVLNIHLEDSTDNCSDCNRPGTSVFTIAQANDSMLGNGGLHDESPVSNVLNTSGARFHGAQLVMGGQANQGSVPSWSPDFGGNLNWNRMLVFYVLWTMQNHGNPTNTGVMLSPFVLELLVNGTWIAEDPHVWNGDFSDRTLAPFFVAAGFNEFEFERGDCLVTGMDAHTGGPADINEGISGHGYGSFVDIPAGYESFRLRFLAKLCCLDENLPDDRALAHYQLKGGADYYADGMTYAPGVGNERAKEVTNDWELFEFKPLAPGIYSNDTSGAAIDANHDITAAEFLASNPNLILTL